MTIPQQERDRFTQEELQFLESREFQRAEIVSLFRVPPPMIGNSETWASDLAFSEYGASSGLSPAELRSMLRRWCAATRLWCFGRTQ